MSRRRRQALGFLTVLCLVAAGPLRADDRADAADFAIKLQQAINGGDADFMRERFAVGELLDRAMAGLEAEPTFEAEFRVDFANNFDLPGILVQAVGAGGYYKFLRITPGEPLVARYRLSTPQGLNYHDVYLRRAGDDWQVHDIYVYRTGERLVNSIRRQYMPFAVKRNNPNGTGLTDFERAYVDNFPAIAEMTRQIIAGKGADGLATYETLPAILKKDKTLRLLRLRAASSAGGDAWRAAVDDLRAAYPADPSVDVAIFEGLYQQERYDEALTTLEAIDRTVGGDPYLDVQRAGIHLKRGEIDAARALGQKAATAEPDLVDAYWIQIVADVRQKRYDDAVKVLNTMIAHNLQPPASLEKDRAHSDFIRSPQYQNWKRAQKED